jgi:hypothetical protein
MRNLTMLTLVLSMTLSQAKATTRSCSTTGTTPSVKEACDKALKDADQVIAKQGELILVIGQENGELRTENQELSNALVNLEREQIDWKDEVIIGGLGLAVGIAIGVMVSK